MEDCKKIERIEKITWSMANADDLNQLADDRAKETKDEFKDKNLDKSYKTPKIQVPVTNEPIDSKVDGNIRSINQGNGHVMDFETYVKSMAKKTEKYNED